ncbi:MAG: isochorismatase family protein [Chloroflexota bacterium]|nr:isochorismatase family protein [Chloroflexota bacterium]MDE3193958.1 isochorismatase family protein [Chloroflexota bacterium]
MDQARGRPAWEGLIPADEIEVYRRAGYQKRYGLGRRPALLVVDVEYNFAGLAGEDLLSSIARYRNSCGPMAWDAIPRIATLLRLARERGIPVAYTHGVTRPDTVRSPRVGTDIVDELAPREGELVVAKEAASAFFGTSLVRHLVEWGVDTVVHTGCVTSGCVRASVVDAAAYGFKNAIVEECVFDRALVPHRANLFDMDAKYGDVMSLAEIEGYFSRSGGERSSQSQEGVEVSS